MRLILLGIGFMMVLPGCDPKHALKIQKEYMNAADSITENGEEKHLLFKDNGNTYTAEFKYYSTNELLGIKGQLLGNQYGSNFHFFSGGSLSEFSYQILNSDQSPYRIRINGHYYSEDGSPLVDHWHKNNSKQDSLTDCTEILFSCFPRRNIVAKYSTDGIKYFPLKVIKSKLLPFVMTGEVKLEKTLHQSIFVITDADRLIMYLPGLKTKNRFYDTILLSRKMPDP